jgi:hypothetical protein
MKGDSGRVVVELDPELKRQLYSALAKEGVTLKQWFINLAKVHISEHEQPNLPGIAKEKVGVKKS